MNRSKRLTVKELAGEIGISVATLDRVLNNRGMVKPQTYQMVMEKIKELNYKPNRSASFLSRKQQLSLAVVFPEHPEYFWRQVEKGIQVAYEEFRDYGLHVQMIRTEGYDPAHQQRAAEQLIESGQYDAIAVSPADPLAATEWIDRAVDAGLAVCTFNNDAPLSKRLFYVGCDYRIAGRVAADILCKMTGTGKVGLITSESNFQMQQKITGFREVVADYRGIELAGPLKVSQDNYTDSTYFTDYLNEVNGVYVSSARLPHIAKHVSDLKPGKRFFLVGHDMTEEIHQYLLAGTVSATICQDPVNQGYLTVKRLFDHLAAEEPAESKANITKLEIVTKENAHYYV